MGFLLARAGGDPGREARLVTTYFDTPEGALARQGLTLRVREEAGSFVQTVKCAGGNDVGDGIGGAALVRGEWEDPIAGASPDPQAPQTGRFVPAEAAEALQALTRTEIARQTFMLRPNPETRIEAAADQGQVAAVDGKSCEPVCEIELELKEGEVTALYDVALDMLAVAPMRLERRSKSARGFRLAALPAELEPAREHVNAVHASAVDLDPEMSAGAALRRIARCCAEQIVRNEAAVLAGMPEGVHQMRVGVRRLRAVLSAFAPLLSNDEHRWLSDELRWLGTVLGIARNLDVFADGLVAPATELIGDVPGLAELGAATAKRRAASYADAVEAIGSARYAALVLRLMRWSEQRDTTDRPSAPLSQPIAEVASRIVNRRLKRVRRRGAGFARQSPKKRHRLRIALKKLRYTAEVLAPLYGPDKTGPLLRAVKGLQEKLGDANDVRMSRDLVAELARSGADAAAVAEAGGAVLDWHRRRLKSGERKTRKQVAKIWKKVSSW